MRTWCLSFHFRRCGTCYLVQDPEERPPSLQERVLVCALHSEASLSQLLASPSSFVLQQNTLNPISIIICSPTREGVRAVHEVHLWLSSLILQSCDLLTALPYTPDWGLPCGADSVR